MRTVGTCDAIVAGIALALDQGLSLPKLIQLAIACSAGAVMSEGTSPASKECVEELMKQVKFEKFHNLRYKKHLR